MLIRTCSASVILVLVASGPAWAQRSTRPAARRNAVVTKPGSIAVADATELTNGWARLAEGNAAQASASAARVLARAPRNAAALTLLVEAEIARAGASAALDSYERWLNGRTIEEPAVLRRVASALLWESAVGSRSTPTRIAALTALKDAGDARAAQQLAAAGSRAGGGAVTRSLAASGDDASVRQLVSELEQNTTREVPTIEALGDSGNRIAVRPIVQRLGDSRQEVRGAAASALGRLGDPAVVPQLRGLLSDRSLYVRAKAAEALLRLGDDSGWPMLQELSLDESSSTRLLAAEAMAARPDASWMVLVRQLTEDENPEIRAEAAHLLAPHDPDTAHQVLAALSTDENPAIRELATGEGVSQETLPADLPSLHRLLRTTTDMARVRAAAQVLAVTR